MQRCGCFLIVLTIALLWGGGQGTMTALGNRSPTELSLAEYHTQRPSSAWLNLKDCELNVIEAS